MPAREVDTGWLMRADFRLETLSGSHESECEKWPAARMLSGLAGRDPGRGCGKTLDLGLRLSEIALIHRQGPRRPGLDRSELVANPSSPKKRRPREVRGQRRDGVFVPHRRESVGPDSQAGMAALFLSGQPGGTLLKS